MKLIKIKILFFFFLFANITSLYAACCCTPASCAAVFVSVPISVDKAIEEMKKNDKDIYSAKLKELNNIFEEISSYEKGISTKEKTLIYVEQTEGYMVEKKNYNLKKLIELEKINNLIDVLLSKTEITNAELMLFSEISK